MKAAVLSSCGRYRYLLRRRWSRGPTVAWLMLNPSTADATKDDPTIRKCVGFSNRWGYGSLAVVNVAAYRATDPKVLYAALRRGEDVSGPENATHVEAALREADAVVVAWGGYSVEAFACAREGLLRAYRPWCLGRTASGQPRHPLMLAYDTARELYFPEVRRNVVDPFEGV